MDAHLYIYIHTVYICFTNCKTHGGRRWDRILLWPVDPTTRIKEVVLPALIISESWPCTCLWALHFG